MIRRPGRLAAGLALVLATAFVLVLAACGGTGEPASGPRLAFDGDEFDLGLIRWDESVERTVPFRNDGVEPLAVSIVKVRAALDAACGCGVEGSEVRPAEVAPGGTGELVFTLRAPESMRDAMVEMRDKMLVELESNDPARPQRTITVIFTMGRESASEEGRDDP